MNEEMSVSTSCTSTNDVELEDFLRKQGIFFKNHLENEEKRRISEEQLKISDIQIIPIINYSNDRNFTANSSYLDSNIENNGTEFFIFDQVDVENFGHQNEIVDLEPRLLFPSCLRINEILTEKGFSPLEISSKDIDKTTKSVSIFIIDVWAKSILNIILEIIDRENSHRIVADSFHNTQIPGNINPGNSNANYEIMEIRQKMKELEKKIKEKDKLNDELEEELKKKLLHFREVETTAQKQLKKLTSQLQDSEVKLRRQDKEILRLQALLQQVSGGGGSHNSPGSVKIKSKSPSSTLKLKLNPNSTESNILPLQSDSCVSGTEIEYDKNISSPLSALEAMDESTQNNNSERFLVMSRNDVNDIEVDENAFKWNGKIIDQKNQISRLTKICDKQSKQLSEKDRIILDCHSTIVDKDNVIKELKQELASRPTPKQWTIKLKEAQTLEEKLQLLQEELLAVKKQMYKYMSMKDLMSTDKMKHNLSLSLIDTFPKAIMTETLYSICRLLDVADISLLIPVIEQLQTAVHLIPKMEDFVNMVMGLVSEDEGLPQRLGSNTDLEDVLKTLKKWRLKANQTESLQYFQSLIYKELQRRPSTLEATDLSSYDIFFSNHLIPDQIPWFARPVRHSYSSLAEHKDANSTKFLSMNESQLQSILWEIRSLVNFQLSFSNNKQGYLNLDNYIQSHPEELLTNIISHIIYLFDTKSAEGLIPKLNQIYVFVAEMKSFLKDMRDVMQLVGGSDEMVLTQLRLVIKLKKNIE